MAKGNRIIVTADPHGTFLEGIIDDTSKPGMCVELVPGSASTWNTAGASNFTNAKPHFRASSHADGAIGPVFVLLEDRLQGFKTTDAYVSGTECFIYAPVAGEDMNMLLGDVAGTADFVTIGDKFGVANGGKIKANNSYASVPFQAMESLAALTADSLIFTKYLGNAS